MADKYTEEHVIHLTDGYAIEVELTNGRKAKLIGDSVQSLITSANDLYHRSHYKGGNKVPCFDNQ